MVVVVWRSGGESAVVRGECLRGCVCVCGDGG